MWARVMVLILKKKKRRGGKIFVRISLGIGLVFIIWGGLNYFFTQEKVDRPLVRNLVIEESLASVFNEKSDWSAKNSSPSAEAKVEIILGGDVMLGRSVNRRQIARGWNWAFQEIGEELAAADWTIVNLETPLLTDCPPTDEGMIFCAAAENVTGLKTAGIDTVNLANNHTLNYGAAGLKETREILAKAGLGVVGETGTGSGSLATKKIDDIQLGLLGFDAVSQDLDEVEVLAQIRAAKKESQVDFLIVTIHWGVEYEFAPRAWQRTFATRIIAAGADAIIGHHSHWVGEREQMKIAKTGQQVPVYYSLGNLVFDQMWSPQTREGLVVKLVLDEKGRLSEIQERRVQIYDYGQPRWDGGWETAQL